MSLMAAAPNKELLLIVVRWTKGRRQLSDYYEIESSVNEHLSKKMAKEGKLSCTMIGLREWTSSKVIVYNTISFMLCYDFSLHTKMILMLPILSLISFSCEDFNCNILLNNLYYILLLRY